MYSVKTLSSAKVDLPSIKQQRVTISATTEYQNVALGFTGYLDCRSWSRSLNIRTDGRRV